MHRTRRMIIAACSIGFLAGCSSTNSSTPPTSTAVGAPAQGTTTRGTVASADPAKADAILALVRKQMADHHLRAVILRVSLDGKEIVTSAEGESMTGVPATTDMHFRNGAVAISYVSTLLLQLVDEGKVSLDDKVSKWLPDLPHADKVTLGQLAQMTSGYPDYVIGNTEMNAAVYANPFRQWTVDELLGFAVNKPLLYEPGTSWNYAHTNYVILGLALEKITGKPVDQLMQEKVLGPLGLTNTTDPGPGTPAIPEPALHAFTSERRSSLGIPAGTAFYEESTFWNPSWTITRGAIQTTNIDDLHATAIAIGTGKLLKPETYKKMISTDLRGTGTSIPGCATCHTQTEAYSYGLGIITTGNWLMQDPLFSGEAGAFAYLPSQKAAIALTVTFEPEAFDDQGDYKYASNEADLLWREIAAILAPDDPPPMKRS